MKGYFVLLCVLYLATLFMSVWSLTNPLHVLVALKNALDIALFSICLAGCFGLAFKRVYLEPTRWRLTYQATLTLGVFSVMLMGFGDRFGVPMPVGQPSLLELGLMFLPYLLFALPVILYEQALKKGFSAVPDVAKDTDTDSGRRKP